MEQKRMGNFQVNKDMLDNFPGKGIIVVPFEKGWLKNYNPEGAAIWLLLAMCQAQYWVYFVFVLKYILRS